MQIQFSTRQAISEACTLLNQNWLTFVLAFVVYFIVTSVLSTIGMPAIPTNLDTSDPLALYSVMFSSTAYLGTTLISAVIGVLFSIGFLKMCFDVIDNGKAQFSSIWSLSANTCLNAFFTEILYNIIICIGTCCCVLPGIFLAVRFSFALSYAIDRGLGPIEALKASWNDTKGNFWHLFLGFILLGLTFVAGYLLCCIGVLYTMPLVYIAYCILSRVFCSQCQEIAE